MGNSVYADIYIMAMLKQAEAKKETYPISRMLTHPAYGAVTGGVMSGALTGGLAAMRGASGKATALLALAGAAAGAGSGALGTMLGRYINARGRDPKGSVLMKYLSYNNPVGKIVSDRAYKGRKAMGGDALMEFER